MIEKSTVWAYDLLSPSGNVELTSYDDVVWNGMWNTPDTSSWTRPRATIRLWTTARTYGSGWSQQSK
ncbi:MAG: hypothetical protein R2722_17420 [Tessaracoccus sp.]